MSKALEALEKSFWKLTHKGNINNYNIIEKELKAFEIIKDFVWMENGEMRLGLCGDVEITLREDDFESKEKYDLLKEVLE